MRKLLVFVLCFFSCVLVGCNKGKEPPKDEALTAEVCSEFKTQTFFLNDEVLLCDFTILITFESGRTETINMASFGVDKLNTSTIGEKTFNFTYEEKDFSVNYVVNDIVPSNAMYKGDALVLYRGENYNFNNAFVSVLYNNGDERNISLTDFTLGNIDYSLTEEERVISATYNGVQVNIPYVVTNRPIQDNVDYNLCDNLNIFSEYSKLIRFVNGKYIVHSGTEVLEEKPGQDANIYSFNRFWSINNVEGNLAKIAFYLVENTIHCEIIEYIE